MKKMAVICLLAALAIQTGGVTTMAASLGNTEAAQEVSGGDLTDLQEETAGETELTEEESDAVQYPADWDPEDPQNERAYRQLLGTEGSQGGSEDFAASQSSELLASALGSIQTQWKTYNTSGNLQTSTFTHSDANTANKDVVAGIDVSYHQGTIDWAKVKASGVKFVILRIGYRATQSGTIARNGDIKFKEYIKGAQAAGLKVGVYFFSQAITEQEGKEEAEWTIEHLKGYKIDLPVVIDYENYSGGRLENANLSKAQKTAVCAAFCKTVKNAGYEPMIYANSSWMQTQLNTESLAAQGYELWMARYNSYSYYAAKDSGSKYGGRIDIWQCSESAKVDGIDSTSVDLDYWYMASDDANEIDEANVTCTSGKVEYVDSIGKWAYVVNGKVCYSYTGVASNGSGWWRIEKGIVNFDYEGLASNENGTWYIKNGQVDFNYTGYVKDGEDVWRIDKGQLNTGFNGVYQYGADWWKFTGGRIDKSYTGISNNMNGWWRIENGKVNFNYNGITNNENGWWKIVGGKVDFGYTGVSNNENGWWRIENGQVNFGYNGIAQNENGWWKIVNGKVDFGYTGVSNNENGWWRIENGKVNFDYNGIAQNSNGWWKIVNGKVDFGYTGWIHVSSGNYYVTNGRVNK